LSVHSSLLNAVGRLVKLSYVISIVLAAIGLITVAAPMFKDIRFSEESRTWLVLLFSCPVILFAIAHYLYESKVYWPVFPAQPKSFAFAVVLALLLPPIFLIFRFSWPEWFRTSFQITSLVGIPLLVFRMSMVIEPLAPETENIFKAAVSYMHLVMWRSWKGTQLASRVRFFAGETKLPQIRRVRAKLYSSKQDLQVFQASLTCPVFDAQIAANAISGMVAKHPLDILDIGGGEGTFTRNLLKQLPRNTIRRLVMVDPCDWQSEYLASLAGVVGHEKIKVHTTSFANCALEPQQFDLVIASHSLYFLLDQHEHSSALVTRLQRLIKTPAGIGIVILASSAARSYVFKANVMRDLFGDSITDATAETLAAATPRLHHEACIDNVFDLTQVLSQYDLGTEMRGPLYSWLSFFLRFNLTDLQESDRDSIVDYLRENIVTLSGLSEQEITRYESVGSLGLTKDSQVLPHKSSLYLWKAAH
jgi:trans-aconitate methyltransferase